MLKTFMFLAVLLLTGAFAQPTVPLKEGESLPDDTYIVARVIDADTFVVVHDGVGRSVRPIGYDAPEPRKREPLAQEATDFVSTFAGPGTFVELAGEARRVDPYGRALANVTLLDARGQPFAPLGELVIAAGLARAHFEPPNTAMTAVYRAAEAGAKSVKKGVWVGQSGRFRDRNCSDFATQEEAQAFFAGAASPTARDRHRLDPNKDMRACESLPGTPLPSAGPSS